MTLPGFSGLMAAPFTPFRGDGDLDPDRIRGYATFLAARGADGAFVCGTTGEAASLTTAEREEVAARWVTAAPPGFPVVVNVAHTSAREAARLAAQAAVIGAAGVSATAPFYFRPAGVADLVAFLADVAAAAPKLPFYYYDIPSTTGVMLPTAEVLRHAAEVIPNLAGVKFSNPDLLSLQECVAFAAGRMDVLFGIDEFLLAALVFGANGAVGSTYNFAAPIFQRMRTALKAGDLDSARGFQFRAAKLVRVMLAAGGIRAGKAIMGMIGCPCGPVRTPLREMATAEERSLRERLIAEVPELFSGGAA